MILLCRCVQLRVQLIDQLKPGGRLVIPVGMTGDTQQLLQVSGWWQGVLRCFGALSQLHTGVILLTPVQFV